MKIFTALFDGFSSSSNQPETPFLTEWPPSQSILLDWFVIIIPDSLVLAKVFPSVKISLSDSLTLNSTTPSFIGILGTLFAINFYLASSFRTSLKSFISVWFVRRQYSPIDNVRVWSSTISAPSFSVLLQ